MSKITMAGLLKELMSKVDPKEESFAFIEEMGKILGFDEKKSNEVIDKFGEEAVSCFKKEDSYFGFLKSLLSNVEDSDEWALFMTLTLLHGLKARHGMYRRKLLVKSLFSSVLED